MQAPQTTFATAARLKSAPATALPNTFLIGASKAGTTSLCRDLEHHSEIYLYPSKETHFFSYRYDEGIDYYRSLFRPSGESIIMEASPEYSTRGNSEQIAARIRRHIPDARLIYMVRNPLRRLESEYIQELANGLEPLAFKDALFRWNLIDGSLYEKNYRIFADAFSARNIHVIFFEDYLADKTNTLSALMQFLGVALESGVCAKRAASNTRAEKIIDPPLVKALRRIRLLERYKHHVPDRLKLALKRRLSSQVRAEIHWNEALLEKVRPVIQNDAEQFLRRVGKPKDYWS